MDSFAGSGDDPGLSALRSLLAGVQLLARTSATSLVRHTRWAQRTPSSAAGRPLSQAEALLRLESVVYELLDAHQITTRLADGLEWDPDWLEHLEYLRRLQRVSREALSAASAPPEPIVDRAG